jgi:hypothetical protein
MCGIGAIDGTFGKNGKKGLFLRLLLSIVIKNGVFCVIWAFVAALN